MLRIACHECVVPVCDRDKCVRDRVECRLDEVACPVSVSRGRLAVALQVGQTARPEEGVYPRQCRLRGHSSESAIKPSAPLTDQSVRNPKRAQVNTHLM